MGNKRPDLRRDCDLFFLFAIQITFIMKQTTWFTKGLRHINRNLLRRFCVYWNKRPDLRRDCDLSQMFANCASTFFTKQTTWFTKGLRHTLQLANLYLFIRETNDLIYEGIATSCPLLRFWSELLWKQTTWFTKGLRLCWFRPGSLYSGYETNDLIYEGIATVAFGTIQVFVEKQTTDLIYEGIATQSSNSTERFR